MFELQLFTTGVIVGIVGTLWYVSKFPPTQPKADVKDGE